MANRRVVITGMGAVTAAGIGREPSWAAVLNGRSGIGPITSFDAYSFPSRIAGELKDFKVAEFIEDRRTINRLSKGDDYGMVAVKMAMDDAGLTPCNTDLNRGGIYIGCGREIGTPQALFPALAASLDSDGRVDRRRFGTEAIRQTHPLFLVKDLPNAVIFYISRTYQIPGGNSNMVIGGTASAQSIGEAYRAVQRGDSEFTIAGGFDARLDPINMSFFCSLGLLSSRNCEPAKAFAPFDALRDGTVVGEGAAMLILEELGHALARGARIYAELVGYAATTNPAEVLGRGPVGGGLAAAISEALRDACIISGQVDYINACGDGTQPGDKSETVSIKQAFGEYAYRVPVSSIKPVIGHMMAASGAAELIFTAMAMEAGKIPPTINYRLPDPDCDLDYVPGSARDAEINTAISLSRCSISGRSAALVLRKLNNDLEKA